MLPEQTIEDTVKLLQLDAKASYQRRIMVIAGSESWCCDMARHFLTLLPSASSLWIGSQGNQQKQTKDCEDITVITFAQAKQWLGQETGYLVINAWSGFDVNGFGALSGTLKAGGLLLLITPPLCSWPAYHDPEHKRIVVYPDKPESITGRYLQRLATIIKGSPDLSILDEQGHTRFQKNCFQPHISPQTFTEGCKTALQVLAVDAIKQVAKGHRRRPLVLTADRGRGKSAALGIGAAVLMKEGTKRIIVTAPTPSATRILFKHAAVYLGFPHNKKAPIIQQEAHLLFKTPDELLQHNETCDLLLIDEAAAIPTPILKTLLHQYARIVFSSTLHGYEGSGRGFSIRFKATLDQFTPQWKRLHLTEPVRWAENDPLERFTYTSLLLNASPVDSAALKEVDWKAGIVEKIDRDELVNNEQSLKELFGLLVLAHYKTTPMDVRHLLDGSNICIYAFKVKHHILATALIAYEGNIDSNLINDIWLGKRRVRGHILPQSLSNHIGIPESIQSKGARIIRVVVHPDIQQKGIGQHLIAGIRSDLIKHNIDYIGSVFGATPKLLDFWTKAGLSPVRIGLTREAASGGHSIMMLQPLTSTGDKLVNISQHRFSEQLPHLLSETFQHLDADIVLKIIQTLPPIKSQLTSSQLDDVYSFAYGQRLYESCITSLKQSAWLLLTQAHLHKPSLQDDIHVLVYKILQNKSWSTVADYINVSGRSQAIVRLRLVFKKTFYLLNKTVP